MRVYTQGLQVCKWYLLWGLKSINRTYFGLFGAPGIGGLGSPGAPVDLAVEEAPGQIAKHCCFGSRAYRFGGWRFEGLRMSGFRG